MSKILLGAVLLLVISSNLAGADVFKCTRPDGTVIFTDNPTQSSGNCTLEKVSDLPPLGTIQDSPRLQAPVPSAKRSVTPPTDNHKAKAYDALKSEAQQLVDQFNDAHRRSIRYSLVSQKQKALRELTEIRARKTNLLNEIDQSSWSDSEKQELRGLLAPITE